jgi:hypothetical protein
VLGFTNAVASHVLIDLHVTDKNDTAPIAASCKWEIAEVGSFGHLV